MVFCLKYKSLPSEKLVQKLLATSFESPSANRQVYDWADSILKHIRFLENERVKLVRKYGEEDENCNIKVKQSQMKDFMDEFSSILEMEINEKIKECPISKDWFDDEKCRYPKDKELWVTPNEIGMFEK